LIADVKNVSFINDSMSNYEIALELTKLVYPDLVALYKHNTIESQQNTDGLADVISKTFNSILSEMPDRNTINPHSSKLG